MRLRLRRVPNRNNSGRIATPLKRRSDPAIHTTLATLDFDGTLADNFPWVRATRYVPMRRNWFNVTTPRRPLHAAVAALALAAVSTGGLGFVTPVAAQATALKRRRRAE